MKRQIDKQHAIKRVSVPAMDNILGWSFPVLDHGFIRVIDYMGDDDSVSQMARVSYGAGTKTKTTDAGLIRYLMRNKHTSPFEGCEIKLHVKLPVFVARQWIRHRMANVNEYSARYSIMADEFYVPEPEVMMQQSTSNKQGRDGRLDPKTAEVVRTILMRDAHRAYENYSAMIYNNPDDPNDPDNVNFARELARINLPVSIYTQWYWKIDLHNLLHFLKLRADPHAQYEIRVYADQIIDILKSWVPAVMDAAEEYIFEAVTFSKTEIETIRNIIRSSGYPLYQFEMQDHATNVSDGEMKEFIRKIGV